MSWRKSRYCDTGACVEAGDWRKSGHSAGSGNCLETGDWRQSRHCAANECVQAAGGVLVRDSADAAGPVLAFSPAAWTRFLGRVRA
jgi:hypothetical protein